MFTTWEFWLFVFGVIVLCQIVPDKWQNILVLGASLSIYTYLEPRFVLLLMALIAFNYWVGDRLTTSTKRRQLFFWLAVGINVGVLAFFKYATSIPDVIAPALAKLGLGSEPLITNFVLPLGLSFYSFRALAYIFDIHSSQISAERNLTDLGLYIAFFPQIASGPIVRPQPFISALKRPRKITQEQFVEGLTFILMGLFYKVAIADPLYSPLVASVPNIQALTSAQAWSELILFTLRIYADFAGYSMMAIGVSIWFGLPVVQNFRQPYFSRTISEFWDRWHISLSTWIRDYIFYPVSRALLRRWGNKRARAIQITAFLVSMTLSGMWHGTGLKFAIWGTLHGIYLSIERVFFPKARVKPKNASRSRIWLRNCIGWAITFAAVSIAWIFFRVNSVTGVWVFVQRLFSSNPLPMMTDLWWIKILTPIILILLIDVPQAVSNNPLFLWQLRFSWRVAMCIVLISGIFIFGSQTHAPFIYIQF